MTSFSDSRVALEDALSEWAWLRMGVPGARTASGDQLSEASRQLLEVFEAAVGRAWLDGHAATDEHGPNDCVCENPYEASRSDGAEVETSEVADTIPNHG